MFGNKEKIWKTKLEMIAIIAYLISRSSHKKRDISFEPMPNSFCYGYFFSFANRHDFKICCSYLFKRANESFIDSYVDDCLRKIGVDGSGFFRAEMKAVD